MQCSFRFVFVLFSLVAFSRSFLMFFVNLLVHFFFDYYVDEFAFSRFFLTFFLFFFKKKNKFGCCWFDSVDHHPSREALQYGFVAVDTHTCAT